MSLLASDEGSLLCGCSFIDASPDIRVIDVGKGPRVT